MRLNTDPPLISCKMVPPLALPSSGSEGRRNNIRPLSTKTRAPLRAARRKHTQPLHLREL